MVLVDTSVIIDLLKNQKNAKVELLEDLIDKRVPWGISDHIYQEILQGSRDAKEFEKLKDYFDTIPSYSLKFGKTSFERAARLHLRCRKSGVTVRSTVDLLIAQTAIENEVPLLHHDSDFDHIGKAVPELRIYKRRFP